MARTQKILLASLLVLPIFGVSVVAASLTKRDEIRLKQQMKPLAAGQLTQSIGIFLPGFEAELAAAKTEYASEHGEGNYQILDYDGYTLLVPPQASAGEFADAKAQVEALILYQSRGTLNAKTQDIQVEKIREVFGVDGVVTYNATLGAYTDEQGFQYNFREEELISKQVGITSALQSKFEAAYPYLQPGVARSAVFSSAQARTKADQMVGKLFGNVLAEDLKTKVQSTDLGEARIGFIYGSNEVYVLVDRVSGDIINYNQETES